MNTQKIITLENQTMKFTIGNQRYVLMIKTNDKIIEYSSELGFNDIKYPFAYSDENIYFMLHRKNIPIEKYKTSTEKNE